MCQPGSQLILCSCKEHQTSRPQKGNELSPYSWTLKHFLGFRETHLMGLLAMPKPHVNGPLTRDLLLTALNSGKAFDFDYAPSERDTLHVCFTPKSGEAEAMNFIYRSGRWLEGRNPGFVPQEETIDNGRFRRRPN